MLSTPILLDYQSSTPCSKDVVDSMKPFWSEIFSNPSSKSNLAGINASAILEASREKIEQSLFLKNKKVIFTSGATESNNLALLGFARNFYKKTGNYGHIITLKTEHKAVLEPLNQLKKEGFMVTEINPEKDGLISEEQFKKNIRDDTFLVSFMLANNEIGVIQPIENISKICKSRGITFHSDFAQCLGYMALDNLLSDVNMITMSSHKIYGPKGIGLLLIDKENQLFESKAMSNLDEKLMFMVEKEIFYSRNFDLPLERCVVWTVNDKDEIDNVLNMNVYGVVTDIGDKL